MVTWVDGPPGDPPRVAFAISRRVGGAVQRNLLRRRLKGVVRDLAPSMGPGTYLFTASPGALPLPFDVLRSEVKAAVEALPVPGSGSQR